MLTWPAYLAPQVIQRFEHEIGTRVQVDIVSSYAEMQGALDSGASGYDVAFPVDFQIRGLIARGLLEKIGMDRLPNFWNIEEVWRSRVLDPRNEYTIPHAWGTTAFVVDMAQLSGDVDSLSLLFEPPPEAQGRILLLDSGYDMVQLALVWLKLPRCSIKPEHLAQAEAVLLPMLRRYPVSDIDTVVEAMASGRNIITVAWNGDALRAREMRPSLRYTYPREGSLVWTDTMVVPKGAPNRTAALKFLSFMMRPEIAALESNYNGYANMIRGSDRHMDARLVSAPEIITPITSSLDFFNYCENGAENQQDQLWRRLRQEVGR